MGSCHFMGCTPYMSHACPCPPPFLVMTPAPPGSLPHRNTKQKCRYSIRLGVSPLQNTALFSPSETIRYLQRHRTQNHETSKVVTLAETTLVDTLRLERVCLLHALQQQLRYNIHTVVKIQGFLGFLGKIDPSSISI